MGHYQIILFDLDGTLTDPKIGITKSVQYALEKMGIVEPDLDKLECFIGPPLDVSFAEYYGFNEDQAWQAIGYYRERFREKGLFENVLYPEIPALLEDLKKADRRLIVATSKPTVYSEQIVKHFDLDRYFDEVVGSNLDGTRTAKTEIIQYILDQFSDRNRSEFVMIGDRKHDLIGANNTGIDSIAVTYGFGSEEELSGEDPTHLAHSVVDLHKIILGK
ncbi:HAD family hydrolase [Sporolactobacillus sp. THM7-4]|nr:HAD family hydrolase [Sporolactobacillus sp. THM7-4]